MSETRYSYEHKVVIERPRNEVLEDFLDEQSYVEWQPNLKRVVKESGSGLKEGRRLTLVFEGSEGDMTMEETILELSLPHKVIVEYRMGTTRNLQYNYFESFGAKTMWSVTTEFHFATEPEASEKVFRQATKRGLMRFKRYVETR